MQFNLTKKNIVFIVIFSVFCLILTILLTIFVYKKNINYNVDKNNYNEYTNIYVTSDKQASIYLNKYYNILNNNFEQAYKMLDEKENDIDFSSLDKFYNFVNKLNFSNSSISKFRTYKNGGYVYFDIFDGNNNHIIFKTQGIMNYTVIFK